MASETGTGKLLDSLPRRSAVTEPCSSEVNVAVGILPTSPTSSLCLIKTNGL